MGLISLKAQWMGTNHNFQMNSLLSTVNVSGWKPLLRPRGVKVIEVPQPSPFKCNLALELQGQSPASQALGQHMTDQKNLTEITWAGIFGSGSIFRSRALIFDLTSITSNQAADKALKVDLTAWNASHCEGAETQLSSDYPDAARFCGAFVTSTVFEAVISILSSYLTACSWAALG